MKTKIILSIIGILGLFCSCEQQLLPKEYEGVPAFLYFDANGGGFGGKNMRIFAGYYSKSEGGYCDFRVYNNLPRREGYTLLGWNYVKDSRSYYTDFANITLTAITDTIFAIWEKDIQPAKVRFRKVRDYTYVTRMGIYSLPMNYTTTKQLESYYFGTYAGTSDYYEIEIGRWYPAYFYTYSSGTWITLNEPFSFEDSQKYTFVTSDDGQYLEFYITKDGSWNAPQRLPEKEPERVYTIKTEIPIR